MKDIVSVHLGSLSTFSGAHYWNFQDEQAGIQDPGDAQNNLDDDRDKPPGVYDFTHSYHSVESPHSLSGHLTHLPRALFIDLKGFLGAAPPVSEGECVYDDVSTHSVETDLHQSAWTGEVEVIKAPRVSPHPYILSLEEDENEESEYSVSDDEDETGDRLEDDPIRSKHRSQPRPTSSKPQHISQSSHQIDTSVPITQTASSKGQANNTESAAQTFNKKFKKRSPFSTPVRYFTDFMKAQFTPHIHSMDLSGFTYGSPFSLSDWSTVSTNEREESLNLLRRQFEMSDGVGCLHLEADWQTGFGGLASLVSDYVRDEAPCSAVVGLFTSLTNQSNTSEQSEGDVLNLHLERLTSGLNLSACLDTHQGHAACFVPVDCGRWGWANSQPSEVRESDQMNDVGGVLQCRYPRLNLTPHPHHKSTKPSQSTSPLTTSTSSPNPPPEESKVQSKSSHPPSESAGKPENKEKDQASQLVVKSGNESVSQSIDQAVGWYECGALLGAALDGMSIPYRLHHTSPHSTNASDLIRQAIPAHTPLGCVYSAFPMPTTQSSSWETAREAMREFRSTNAPHSPDDWWRWSLCGDAFKNAHTSPHHLNPSSPHQWLTSHGLSSPTSLTLLNGMWCGEPPRYGQQLAVHTSPSKLPIPTPFPWRVFRQRPRCDTTGKIVVPRNSAHTPLSVISSTATVHLSEGSACDALNVVGQSFGLIHSSSQLRQCRGLGAEWDEVREAEASLTSFGVRAKREKKKKRKRVRGESSESDSEVE
eukprot:GHVN01076886.1.p1 GENE.GHVN01076886.1~~GHVN01076886.1.p1  ORF type:complete len:760 (-),score=250.27 GHVN01076886.1:459-2738(-)